MAGRGKAAAVQADRLSESLEDYLEAILHIEEDKNAARPKDIAQRLRVSPPSVTAALQNLAGRGLVNYQPYDLVTLTSRGRRIARDVARRHDGLRRFLIDILHIEFAEADTVACSMEHALPSHILIRLVEFIDFLGQNPNTRPTWSPESGFGLRPVHSSAKDAASRPTAAANGNADTPPSVT